MKKIVGIIGGKGRTGSQFAGFFKKMGFDVIVSDIGTKLSNKDLIKKADIVVFSVPFEKSVQIMKKEILACTRKDQIVMDLSSLKKNQVEVMNKSKGNVIGIHPLFGPTTNKKKDLNVVFCAGRCDKKVFAQMKKLFEKFGFNVIVMTPEEHDKAMVLVQVIPHLKIILAGELMKFSGINPEKFYDIGTPMYKVEMSFIGRIFAQDPGLCTAIIVNNPYSKDLIKFFGKISKVYEKLILKNDIKGLSKRFVDVSKFLGDFPKTALDESEKIINKM
ncbi:MAG: prephenate dehydrogenase/arogenate dehydrogenase family protein [Candidatus Peregrinibacteria bacterium]|nr:prephenate dehydrogenase/arogenate dehydrogenase family protein [Candidatus Peregrinibacteria bacterium]